MGVSTARFLRLRAIALALRVPGRGIRFPHQVCRTQELNGYKIPAATAPKDPITLKYAARIVLLYQPVNVFLSESSDGWFGAQGMLTGTPGLCDCNKQIKLQLWWW